MNIFKSTFLRYEKRGSIYIAKAGRLLPSGEVTDIYSENHSKSASALCGKKEGFNAKEDGVYVVATLP
jgi:hypothetical protein